MKIIKKGKIQVEIFDFTCGHCGCRWIAERTEVNCTDQMGVMHDNLPSYNMRCPCCTQLCYCDKTAKCI